MNKLLKLMSVIGGFELKPVSLDTGDLETVKRQGVLSVAIVFMHGYRYPKHEQEVVALARDLGFTQISVSHEVSPLIKFISRGDTTVVDAYLSPILRRYINRIAKSMSSKVHGFKNLFLCNPMAD